MAARGEQPAVRTGTAGRLRTRRREPPDVRREQILDAAERVLLDRGLAATTMADVASAAGVAKGTVYLYFESKTALLAGLRARYLERFGNLTEDLLGAGEEGGYAARLDRFVERLFRFGLDNIDLHHLLFHEAGFSQEEDAFATVEVLLARLVEEGVAAGELNAPDLPLTAAFLLGGLHHALVTAVHAPGATGSEHAIRVACELARRVLLPRGGAHPPSPSSSAG